MAVGLGPRALRVIPMGIQREGRLKKRPVHSGY